MGIICNIMSEDIKTIAKELNISDIEALALVGVWQRKTKNLELPKKEQFKELTEIQKELREKKLNKATLKEQQERADAYTRLNSVYTPKQRRDRAVKIAKAISEKIDDELDDLLDTLEEKIKETKDEATKNKLLDELSILKGPEGRHLVIQKIGLTKLFDDVKSDFEKLANNDSINPIHKAHYETLVENYTLLFDEACSILETTESIRVSSVFLNEEAEQKKSDGFQILPESFIDEYFRETKEQDNFDEDGNAVLGNEGWSYQVRFINPHSTLSKEVKKILSTVEKFDSNGKPILDDFGGKTYYDPEYIHTALLDIFSEITNPDDFCEFNEKTGKWSFPLFEQNAQYDWIKSIQAKLKFDDNAISKFYSDLRKDFIPYWKQVVEYKGGKRKLLTIQMNTNNSLAETIQNIKKTIIGGRVLASKNSLYDTNGKFNRKLAYERKDDIKKLYTDVDAFFNEKFDGDVDKLISDLTNAFESVGFNYNRSCIKSFIYSKNLKARQKFIKALMALNGIYDKIGNKDAESNYNTLFNDIFSGEKVHCRKHYETIAESIGIMDESSRIASFRDEGKLRYSYSAPNYVNTLIKNLHKDKDSVRKFLEENFSEYGWFYSKNGQKYKSGWLRFLEGDNDGFRNNIAIKELLNINGKHYNEWDSKTIKAAFIAEFFATSQRSDNDTAITYAWYNFPILADSKACIFIRAPRFHTKGKQTYQKTLTTYLTEVVKQELYRINLVKQRQKGIKNGTIKEIQNFDKRGAEFCFFPELNNIEGFYDNCYNFISKKEGENLNKYIDNTIEEIMNDRFNTFIKNLSEDEKNAIIDNLVSIGVIKKSKSKDANEAKIENEQAIIEPLREYFWNQEYATTQIIELTTTDLAYYKDDVDFQKRYKEIYASGTKLNTNAKNGKKFRKALYLSDRIISSNTLGNINDVLNESVRNGRISKIERDRILNSFKEINAADAQAYVSPQTMKSILCMLGSWSDEMEEALQRFENNEWDMHDFTVIWQTIKPFVYTQIGKPTEFDSEGRILDKLKVPHQNKNSEFLLLAAYQLIANSLNKAPLLSAMQKFMKEKDIDVIQFSSAVKAGGQGIIDLNYYQKKVNRLLDDENNKWLSDLLKKKEINEPTGEDVKKLLDELLLNNKISQEIYNNIIRDLRPNQDNILNELRAIAFPNGKEDEQIVHTISYDDYMIQQPTPEHLKDTTALIGTQIMSLAIADLTEDFKTKIHGNEYNKQQLIDLYNSCIIENLLDSYEQVYNKCINIHELQKEMIRSIKSTSKDYNMDLINALQIKTITVDGEQKEVFNIPPNSPNIVNDVQQIMITMFKNKITQQKIKGGNAILVSDVGLTNELQLKYEKDENGKQRLAGVECYLPASSKKFYEHFLVTKTKKINGKEVTYQELDVKKLEDAGLDKLIGYRIPTENKYSMCPLIVKGFLPEQNGSCIMLPADIVNLAGSDFKQYWSL